MPKDLLIKAKLNEAQAVATYLGNETATNVKQLTDRWYVASFIETGLLKATYDFLLHQWEGKEHDLNFDDRGLSKLVDKRLDVFWLAIHLAYYRFATMMIWLPYVIPLLLVSSIDGLVQREIRKWQFSYSSPAAHQAAARAIFAVVVVTVLSPFLPFALPPIAMPILMGIVAIALWVNMANIQKRI